jgi:cysteinyl-tRNA synthetase
MAKSEGNSVTLSSLKNLGIHPLAYRLWLLGTHYRMTASFDEEAVRAAQNAHDTLIRAVAAFPPANDARRVSLSTRHQSLFQAALEDDINTPKALAVLWEVTRDPSLSPEQKRETIRSFERVLGLNLFEEAGKLSEVRMPPEALALQKERDKARAEKDFVTADTLRKEIEKLGFAVEDGETGSTLRPLRTR